ncbi:trypsin Inhibitor like cysteine rich domain protein [Oesophagostomum dentatum]|uniref:Trypsin Inhibitor like cysteine rich domain protein n=1 Tax=Oesophagostomum dentatum TaxID=61180 RepID=A0A0B1RXJ6_OESDE|nr:trypsin Inhibitor like cysteine rich domain protein [Oesophagostomum dentatum]
MPLILISLLDPIYLYENSFHGLCIRERSFVGKEKCGENEERKKCGTACERSCSNPSPVCTKQCILNVCQCKPGYTRDDATNKCISYDSCPKDRVIPCSEMNCPKGTRCELGRVICPFVPPCFTRQTICVSSETCKTKKCPPGTECQQETINCFVAPCPQPEPQCVPKG